MAKVPLFVGGTYESASLNADCQRAMNLYPEIVESGAGKNGAVLYGTPGIRLFTTLPRTPIRGLWVNEYRLFAAAANFLYEVFQDGTHTERGQIGAETDTPVLMYPNGNQLFIIAGGKGFLDDGLIIREVINAVTGCFLDGYFIAHDAFDLKTFHWSALYDGLTWDPLDYATKEGHPDNLRRAIASHEDLWLIGAETSEVWRDNRYDGGTATGNPWEKDPGAFIQQGCVAPWSVVLFRNSIAWLGGDTRGRVSAWIMNAYEPVRISTHAIEQVWKSYSSVSDAVAYTYVENGHEFWVINFPAGNATWVYDASTRLWHERGWWNGTGFDRQRGAFHAFVFNRHLLGDWQNGNIYESSTSIYDDNGTPIRRIRTTPHMSEEELRSFFYALQLDVETGEAANPEFSLEMSNDHGHTWSAARTIAAGPLNAYASRAIWRRLGSARDRVFRLTSSAAMRHAWINAYLQASTGTG